MIPFLSHLVIVILISLSFTSALIIMGNDIFPSASLPLALSKVSDTGKEKKVGIIVVDHGSKREVANLRLIEVVKQLKKSCKYDICEPAHMELAEPTISTAYQKCVEQGANFIICHPFFLAKGKHFAEDIPRLLENAARQHKDTSYFLTDPLGCQEGVISLMQKAIESTDVS